MEQFWYVFGAGSYETLVTDVFEICLPQSSSVHWDIRTGNSEAGGFNWEVIFPNPLNVRAGCVKLPRQNHVLMGVVNAKGRDGVAFHPHLFSAQANIGPI
jgi:hypothetical protein